MLREHTSLHRKHRVALASTLGHVVPDSVLHQKYSSFTIREEMTDYGDLSTSGQEK